MVIKLAEKLISSIPGLEKYGSKVASGIHSAVLKGGAPTRKIADVLHGTWLGHPLHPVLTDLAVGAWSLGALFDAMAANDRSYEQVADTLTTAGTVAAVPTLITGLTEYSTTQTSAMSTASLHGLSNNIIVVLYYCSIRERRRGNRKKGLRYSNLAIGLAVVSAWLGGHLVYGHKVGVDHSEKPSNLNNWTPVLEKQKLADEQPQSVDVKGKTVLLYRCQDDIYAIGNVCSHAGGPLDQGQFKDCAVQCPWHDSVFHLRDGSIKHGPATHPQPSFEVRVRDGQIEVRSPQQHT